MHFKIAVANDHASERALASATVFAALGLGILWPNTANRFAYSKREVLFAT